MAKTKNDQKIKKNTASPTSHSARGPGDGAQLERPLRAKKKYFYTLLHSLSPPAGWGLALGSDGQDQKRPKNKKTRREPHLTQRT
jgi:hypothetical protein